MIIPGFDAVNNYWNISPGWLAHRLTNGKWQYAEHLRFIDNMLVKLTNREFDKLIINMPPRHGKSELISKYFPFWYLSNNPTHQVILSTYNHNLARSFGRKIFGLFQEFGESVYSLQISNSAKSSSNFEMANYCGSLSCYGVGGTITGKGADLLIIDDPIKNDKEANSATIRNNIWEWFKATAFTRLEPNGIIIIVMTRWNEQDLCGKIIEDAKFKTDIMEQNWKIISLPAIAEFDDEINRNPGDPLWEKRFPLKKLNNIKSQIGDYWFSSLYQQKPSPIGDFIFKRKYFKYFRFENQIIKKIYSETKSQNIELIKLSDCSIFSVADLAATVKETSDFTVVMTFALSPKNDIFILDIVRERIEGADHLNLLKRIQEKWNPVLIGIENTQYQISLIQSGVREGLPIKSLRADKDKISRALPIAAKMELGNVYFLESANWLFEFENELLSFPKGKNDDQVDAFAYCSYIVSPVSQCLPAASLPTNKINNKISQSFDLLSS